MLSLLSALHPVNSAAISPNAIPLYLQCRLIWYQPFSSHCSAARIRANSAEIRVKIYAFAESSFYYSKSTHNCQLFFSFFMTFFRKCATERAARLQTQDKAALRLSCLGKGVGTYFSALSPCFSHAPAKSRAAYRLFRSEFFLTAFIGFCSLVAI